MAMIMAGATTVTENSYASSDTKITTNGNGGTTDVGTWFTTYNNEEQWSDNLSYGFPTEHRPLDQNGNYSIPNSTDPDLIDFYLEQMADAKIDFVVFDETNGGMAGYFPANAWIVDNAALTAERIKIWNDNNTWQIKYALAVGAYPALRGSDSIGQTIENQAEYVYDNFYENASHGGPDNYYQVDGKPLILVYGLAAVDATDYWNSYTGTKTHGDDFTIRTAQDGKVGTYGWQTTYGTQIHPEVEVVSPGFNAHHSSAFYSRDNGGYYEDSWNTVLHNDLPRIVMITAFNDHIEDQAVWTTDTSNNVGWYPYEEKWYNPDGVQDPSMYWEMTKEYIDVLRGGGAPSAGGNLAASAAATASSSYPGYNVDKVVDGDRNTNLGEGHSWASDGGGLPQWLELDFGSEETFNRVDLYLTSGYEVSDYQLQYWNGESWEDLGSSVKRNSRTLQTHPFPEVTATKVRVLAQSGPNVQPEFIRVNEVEVYDDDASPFAVAPSAPTKPAASGGAPEVSLSWEAPAGASSYTVRRGTTAGGPYPTVVASEIESTLYKDTSVEDGTTYYYAVSAVNDAGESGNAREVTATPSAKKRGLTDGGFETPSLVNTPDYLAYAPTTNDWKFEGTAGIQRNGSAFGTRTAPDGVQTAFIHASGRISQSLDFIDGKYTISLQASQRVEDPGTQSFDVYYGADVVGSFSLEEGDFSTFTTESFATVGGKQSISIVGTSTENSVGFIDDVVVTWLPQRDLRDLQAAVEEHRDSLTADQQDYLDVKSGRLAALLETATDADQESVEFQAAVEDALFVAQQVDRWVDRQLADGLMPAVVGADLRLPLEALVENLSKTVSRLQDVRATLAPESDEVVAGETLRVETALTNSSSDADSSAEHTLTAPDGWTVEAVDPTTTKKLRAGATFTTRWDVTPPLSSEPGEADLTSSSSYRLKGNAAVVQPSSAPVTVRAPAEVTGAELATPLLGGVATLATVTVANHRSTEPVEVRVELAVPQGWTAEAATVTVPPSSSGEVAVPVTAPGGVPAEGALPEHTLTATGKATGMAVGGAPVVRTVVVPDGAAAVLALDGGSTTSPVLGSYSRLTPGDAWDPATGYGWTTTTQTFRDRGAPDDLLRDFALSRDPATLRLHVPAGKHVVSLLRGENSFSSGHTVVKEGDQVLIPEGPNLPKGQYVWEQFTLDGGATGRDVDLEVSNTGGSFWRLVALVMQQP